MTYGRVAHSWYLEGYQVHSARLLWKLGRDTLQIAIELNVPESTVWNSMAQIRVRQ